MCKVVILIAAGKMVVPLLTSLIVRLQCTLEQSSYSFVYGLDPLMFGVSVSHVFRQKPESRHASFHPRG